MRAAGHPAFAAVALDDDPGRHADLLRRLIDWLEVETVLDVGGHKGSFVEVLRRQVGYAGRVVSFEPDATNAQVLTSRAAADPAWRVDQLALSDRSGRLPLFRFDRSNFNSLHAPTESLSEWFEITSTGEDLVDVVRLDDWLDGLGSVLKGPMFLKVDTQGHDWAVIEGAARRLSDVVAIQLELSVLPLYEGAEHWTDVIARLEGLGFWPAGLFPVTRDPGLLRVTEFDGVFTRDL